METTYQPNKIEAHWGKKWEEKGYGKPKGNGKPYCIMIPPPNVTGSLHMGHGFQVSIMDSLIRYKRMQQHKTLWQVGTDHAGIATQIVVERNLSKQNISRKELGREKFLEKIWEWKDHSGGRITQQLRRLGASVDWSRERFTMDKGLSNAVEKLFIKLYKDKLIYRGHRLVNWDPKLETAISDLEVINEERSAHLWHFRYPIANTNNHLVVATTRPETMLGDTAVAVHPEDKRYQHLIGKKVNLPLSNREIPIIADTHVDPEFGSGCVKITPAHDFNDYAMGQRHKLEMINIFTTKAIINENAPKRFQGLTRELARKEVLKEMKELDLIEKIVPHTLKVPLGDKSGEIIEPYLTLQWFVKSEVLAEPALKAVKNGDIVFHPKNYENTYFRWLENIQHWCISRQLWWGHRIPAWYDDKGNTYVGSTKEDIFREYNIPKDTKLKQDEDVLDTWFSSALWPFATLGWPDKTEDLETYLPTQVLVTGHDIIFYWVARMVMMSLYCTNKIPFKDVYITGLIRDDNNEKMSKSKGNVLDPLDLIDGIDLESLIKKRTQGLMLAEQEKKITKETTKKFPNGLNQHGTDALRFTFCALASTGRSVRFDLNRLSGYRNFCNKLWNGSRFVLNQIEKAPKKVSQDNYNFYDLWILSRLEKCKNNVARHFNNYRFDLLTQCLYDFIWHDYCDWYIELTKCNHLQNSEKPNPSAHTLITVLEESLRLLHPIIPFITEEIWQSCKKLCNKNGESIMLEPWPEQVPSRIKNATTSEEQMVYIQNIITTIRQMRSEMQISPAKKINILITGQNSKDTKLLHKHQTIIETIASCNIADSNKQKEIPASAKQEVSNLKIHIPLEGLIEKETEINRVNKQIHKLKKQLDQLEKKLANSHYLKHAPKDVIEEEQKRVLSFKNTHQNYLTHLEELNKIKN